MNDFFARFKKQPEDYFRLIPQVGIKHTLVEEWPTHNAIWDMAVSPEGRVFFSVCGEGRKAEYARLYEYDYAKDEMIHHFNLEEEIILQDRTIRTSKFHTAICFMGDGKLISTTHTTSPSPLHPTWMPYEYANHQWEGYAGSNLIIYDYINREVKNLGVLSPFDTTYGSVYDAKNGDYLGITWMQGTGYVYHVPTGTHRCLGQLTDTHTSRMFPCSDGHIYFCTYSGVLMRYNTDSREVEDMGVDFGQMIRHAAEYQGVLYGFTGPCSVAGRGQELFAYDLKTREVKKLGRPVPAVSEEEGAPGVFMNAYGLAIDDEGKLWYGCMSYTPEITYCGARLYCWDVLHSKEPIDYGFCGTKKRTVSITAEMRIANGILYISDGNHNSDEDTACGILAIDLEKFQKGASEAERPFSVDYINYLPYPLECSKVYPQDDYETCWDRWNRHYEGFVLRLAQFQKENSCRVPCKHASGISWWQKLGRENSIVHGIYWKDDSSLELLCGKEDRWKISVCIDDQDNAHVTEIVQTQGMEPSEKKAEIPEGVQLPYVAGRQYLAVSEASVSLADGSVVVGTKDSMMAVIKGKEVFSLGAVCSCGGVHSLDTAPDGKTVYGVAGYPKGIGVLFCYDAVHGIKQLGYLPEALAENGRNVCIFHPVTLAVSPSGKYLAVGGMDELGGAVVLKL